jgi:hypothetical protein
MKKFLGREISVEKVHGKQRERHKRMPARENAPPPPADAAAL